MIYPDQYYMAKVRKWDTYYMDICYAIAKKSPCMSRQIGAVLVRNNSIISTGYNGPARGVPHCDQRLQQPDYNDPLYGTLVPIPANLECPRRLLGFPSGKGLEYCTAVHAEVNCISNAARSGVSTLGATLYLNTVMPCKDCMATVINAGITLIVCYPKEYDSLSKWMADKAHVKVRRFEPCEQPSKC